MNFARCNYVILLCPFSLHFNEYISLDTNAEGLICVDVS